MNLGMEKKVYFESKVCKLNPQRLNLSFQRSQIHKLISFTLQGLLTYPVTKRYDFESMIFRKFPEKKVRCPLVPTLFETNIAQ